MYCSSSKEALWVVRKSFQLIKCCKKRNIFNGAAGSALCWNGYSTMKTNIKVPHLNQIDPILTLRSMRSHLWATKIFFRSISYQKKKNLTGFPLSNKWFQRSVLYQVLYVERCWRRPNKCVHVCRGEHCRESEGFGAVNKCSGPFWVINMTAFINVIIFAGNDSTELNAKGTFVMLANNSWYYY